MESASVPSMTNGPEESIRKWLSECAPGFVPLFEQIVGRYNAGESSGCAMMQLLCIGWRAGLQHQHDHPEDWPELVARPSTTEAAHGVMGRGVRQLERVLGALATVLPYAESRAEDLDELAREAEDAAVLSPQDEQLAVTAADARAAAGKAAMAVDDAKLASEGR